MTWFRVDDRLPDHRKARKAGTSAMGLWLLTGAWSAGHLTDGWVPREVALRYGTERQAERLVAAGLWSESEVDGEPGWVFHQWTEHQPTRDEVQLRRKNAADRQAKWRAKKQDDAGQDDLSRGDSRASNDVSNAAPDPTRPDQKIETKTTSSSTRKRGERLPDDFPVTDEMREWAREHAPTCGARDHEAFCDYWRGKSGKDATKVDWVATWRNWMRREHDRRQQNPRASPNGRHSTDDNIARLMNTPLRALPGGQA